MATRRQLLQVGLGGVAVVAVGGGAALLLRGTVSRSPRRPLRALTPAQFSVLAAVADRVAPQNGEFPSAWTVQVPEKIDELLSRVHPGLAGEVGQGLMLLESAAAGMLLEGRTTTFTGSTPTEQDEILTAWRASDLEVRRKVLKALNGLCNAAYYGSPEVYPAVGYPGPPPRGSAR